MFIVSPWVDMSVRTWKNTFHFLFISVSLPLHLSWFCSSDSGARHGPDSLCWAVGCAWPTGSGSLWHWAAEEVDHIQDSIACLPGPRALYGFCGPVNLNDHVAVGPQSDHVWRSFQTIWSICCECYSLSMILKLSVQQNPLEGLLNLDCWTAPQRCGISRSGVETSSRKHTFRTAVPYLPVCISIYDLDQHSNTRIPGFCRRVCLGGTRPALSSGKCVYHVVRLNFPVATVTKSKQAKLIQVVYFNPVYPEDHFNM